MHLRAFDEEDLSADGGPSKTRRHSRLGGAFGDFRSEPRRPEVRPERFFIGNRPGSLFAFCHLHRDAANDTRDLTLEVTHPGLAGVVVDDRLDRRIFECDCRRFDAVLPQLLGHEMHARDIELFSPGVAGNFDDLHPVLERSWNGVADIGSGDEHDLR